jgi:hypothetical protein
MPSLNFNAQFADDVESGKKPHTIRAKRKRPIKVGETLYLFTGMRTKKCRRLRTETCTSAQEIVIHYHGRRVLVSATGLYSMIQMDRPGIEALAERDGFKTLDEFFGWFVSEKNPVFEGQLIWWTDPEKFIKKQKEIAW